MVASSELLASFAFPQPVSLAFQPGGSLLEDTLRFFSGSAILEVRVA